MVLSPNLAAKSSVPWDFSQSSDDYLQYVWTASTAGAAAPAFQASIICDAGRWSWDVVADPTGTPSTIAAGAGPSKEYCEELVLEAVGKAFADAPSVHRGLASDAAKRYTLATGKRVDLARGQGHRVAARMTDGSVWSGVLHVGGWLLILEEEDGSLVRLNPAQVVDIRPA